MKNIKSIVQEQPVEEISLITFERKIVSLRGACDKVIELPKKSISKEKVQQTPTLKQSVTIEQLNAVAKQIIEFYEFYLNLHQAKDGENSNIAEKHQIAATAYKVMDEVIAPFTGCINDFIVQQSKKDLGVNVALISEISRKLNEMLDDVEVKVQEFRPRYNGSTINDTIAAENCWLDTVSINKYLQVILAHNNKFVTNNIFDLSVSDTIYKDGKSHIDKLAKESKYGAQKPQTFKDALESGKFISLPSLRGVNFFAIAIHKNEKCQYIFDIYDSHVDLEDEGVSKERHDIYDKYSNSLCAAAGIPDKPVVQYKNAFKQNNSYDCGVFVALHCALIAQNNGELKLPESRKLDSWSVNLIVQMTAEERKANGLVGADFTNVTKFKKLMLETVGYNGHAPTIAYEEIKFDLPQIITDKEFNEKSYTIPKKVAPKIELGLGVEPKEQATKPDSTQEPELGFLGKAAKFVAYIAGVACRWLVDGVVNLYNAIVAVSKSEEELSKQKALSDSTAPKTNNTSVIEIGVSEQEGSKSKVKPEHPLTELDVSWKAYLHELDELSKKSIDSDPLEKIGADLKYYSTWLLAQGVTEPLHSAQQGWDEGFDKIEDKPALKNNLKN